MKQKILYIFGSIFFVLAVELYFLISLPAQTKASTNPPNSDGCSGFLTVATSDNACDANYTGMYHVQSANGQAFHIVYTTQSYYCTNPHPTEGSQPGRPVCLENGSVNNGAADIPAGGSTTISVAAPIQNSCGSAQTDLSFDAFQNGNKVCSYGNTSNVFGWSFCTTNMSCNQPSPTATPIPTSAPSPNPTMAVSTPSPTPAITMEITLTPTPTESEVTPIPATPAPTEITPTPMSTTTTINQTNTACSNITQNGVNTNINCQINQQQQNNTQGSSQNSTQNQTQSQNVTNSSVPIAAAAPSPQVATAQTLATATVAPAPQASQLPSTGGEPQVLLEFLGLIPIGWKLRRMK